MPAGATLMAYLACPLLRWCSHSLAVASALGCRKTNNRAARMVGGVVTVT